MEALVQGTILRLPDELLLLIAKHLNASDFLSFSASCRRFDRVCQMISNLNFVNNHSNGMSIGNSAVLQLHSFLSRHTNPQVLKSCDFSGCYWLDLDTLQSFLIQCNNLKKLFLAETSYSLNQIMIQIFPHCPGITHLSFNLRKHDRFHDTYGPKLLKSLEKLLSVEIVMEDGSLFTELLKFLQKCPNMEDLVVSRASVKSIEQMDVDVHNPATIGPFPKLKSLIFVGFPLGSAFLQPFLNIGPSDKQRELTTFWTNVLDIPFPDSELNNFVGLSWNPLQKNMPEDQNIREKVRLPTLHSVWEPFSTFMLSPDSSPQLKLVSCVYDGLTFRDFCFNHQAIEVLKIKYGNGTDETARATALAWDYETWQLLPNLTTISLDAFLIARPNEGSMQKKWREQFDGSYIPFMGSLALGCPLVHTLELIGKNLLELISGNDLAAIAHCLNLRNLTLSGFNMDNGQFFYPVLENCKQLESLRLKNIGPSKSPCNYASSLAASLPSARNLRTFCMLQRAVEVPDIKKLMNSLENCRLLTRVSLVCPAMTWSKQNQPFPTVEFRDRFKSFCENIGQLVAFFAVLKVPVDACQLVTSVLNDMFRQQRPAFCADIQPSKPRKRWHTQCYSEILPLMHSDLLCQVESKVALYPFARESVLERLT